MGECRITVLGLSFKEDVPDLRNTRVVDIIHELEDYGLTIQVHDPRAAPEEARQQLGVNLMCLERLEPAQCVVLAVAHREFLSGGWEQIRKLLVDGKTVVADVKGVLDRREVTGQVYLWRLREALMSGRFSVV